MIIKRKKPCTRCITGIKVQSLDSRAPMCPYIECINENKCAFFKPVKTKSNILKRIIILFKSGD